jgi:cytochrome c
MLKCVLAILAVGVFIPQAAAQQFGVGRRPTAEEAKSWDISIMRDGTNLPPGSGTPAQGADLYERRCQRCHGAKAEGGDAEPLVGGQGSLATAKPLKTVGSYWPYSTTLFDYIRRAMPFNQPGILTDDQVYAATAFILRLNGIIGESDVMSAETLPKVQMPNREGFIPDGRPKAGSAGKKASH